MEPAPLTRLLVSPGSWARLSCEATKAIEGANPVFWEPGADPGVLGQLSANQTFCELTPNDPADKARAVLNQAASKAPLLIQARGSASPKWATAIWDGASTSTMDTPPSHHEDSRTPRVLLTRRHRGNQSTAQALAARDVASLSFPTLALAPPQDLAKVQATLSDLSSYFGVMVTSAQGARVLCDQAPLPAGLKIVAVGASTAKALAENRVHCDLYPHNAHSEGLVDALGEQKWLAKSWLHLRGDKGRGVIENGVLAAGGQYHLLECYRNERPNLAAPLLRAAMDPAIEIVSFASGQSFHNFQLNLRRICTDHAIATLLNRLSVISFGPVTTQAIKKTGIVPTYELDQPSEIALQAAIFALI